MTLRFATDMPHEEIAAALGCSPEAARRSLHEGLKRLRKEMRMTAHMDCRRLDSSAAARRRRRGPARRRLRDRRLALRDAAAGADAARAGPARPAEPGRRRAARRPRRRGSRPGSWRPRPRSTRSGASSRTTSRAGDALRRCRSTGSSATASAACPARIAAIPYGETRTYSRWPRAPATSARSGPPARPAAAIRSRSSSPATACCAAAAASAATAAGRDEEAAARKGESKRVGQTSRAVKKRPVGSMQAP